MRDGGESFPDGAVEDRVDVDGLVAEQRAEPEGETVDQDDVTCVCASERGGEVASDLDGRPSRRTGGPVTRDPVIELGIAGPRGREEPDTVGPSGQPRRGRKAERALPAARPAKDQDEGVSHRRLRSREKHRGGQPGGHCQLDDRTETVAIDLATEGDDQRRSAQADQRAESSTERDGGRPGGDRGHEGDPRGERDGDDAIELPDPFGEPARESLALDVTRRNL